MKLGENIAKAFVDFQADLVPVGKTKENPFFHSSYAPLDEIKKTVQPILSKHGLAVSQMMSHIDGSTALKTIVIHESGETFEDVTPLLLTKQDSQAHGSAVTYARRYGYMSALGIVAEEDDDGNEASNPKPKPQKQWRPDPNKPASDQQKVFIFNLLRQRGINKDEQVDYLADNYGILPNTAISQTDAQMIIDDFSDPTP